MSVSSGSDITIPIQDSPPPPPSPYAGTNGGSKGNDASTDNKSTGGVGGTVTIIDTSAGGDNAPGGKTTPEPRGDVTVTVGFVNEAYQDHSPDRPNNHSDKNGHTKMTNGQKKNSNGAISISVPGEGSEKGQQQEIHINEAVNPELINMNILNTIPDKPNPEYGPYDNLDEYFVPVNQHKKFLRRSEKLYVTKDKRKETHWKKYICWLLGASILAAIVTVAVLAGIGLIPQKSPNHFDSVVGTTSATESGFGDLSSEDVIISSSPESSLPSSTEINTPPSVPVDATYVPMAADIHFHITDLSYESALNDKTSDRFQELASEVQDEVKDILKRRAGLRTVYSRVTEFAPGSVFVKMRIGWLDQAMDYVKVRMTLANVTSVGQYRIMPIMSYEVVNHCKFNKNGCSNNCSYDYIQMDFMCSCGNDDTLFLAEDKKTCVSIYGTTSSTTSEIPLLPEFSSYSPLPVSEEETSPVPPSTSSSSSEEDVHSDLPESHTHPAEPEQPQPTNQPEEEHDHQESEEPFFPTAISHETEPETSTEADLPSETLEPVSHEHHHEESEMIPIVPSSTTSTSTTEAPLEPVSEEVIEPEHHHEEEHQPVIVPVETTTPSFTSTSTTPTPEPLPILLSSSEETNHHQEEATVHPDIPAVSVEPQSQEGEVNHGSTEVPASEEHHSQTGSSSSEELGRIDLDDGEKSTEAVPLLVPEVPQNSSSSENATIVENVRDISNEQEEEEHAPIPLPVPTEIPELEQEEIGQTTVSPVHEEMPAEDSEKNVKSDHVPADVSASAEEDATTSVSDETNDQVATTVVPDIASDVEEPESVHGESHDITPMDVLSFSSSTKDSSSTTPTPVVTPVHSEEQNQGRSASSSIESSDETESINRDAVTSDEGAVRSQSLTEDENESATETNRNRAPRLFSTEMGSSMQLLSDDQEKSGEREREETIVPVVASNNDQELPRPSQNVTESASVETADENPEMASAVTKTSSEDTSGGASREAVTSPIAGAEGESSQSQSGSNENNNISQSLFDSSSQSGESSEVSQESPVVPESDSTSGESTTFTPLSLHHDIDINYLGNNTEDHTNSEPVQAQPEVETIEGENVATHDVEKTNDKLMVAPEEDQVEATTVAPVPAEREELGSQSQEETPESPAASGESGESRDETPEVRGSGESSESQDETPGTTTRGITTSSEIFKSEEALESPNRDHRDTSVDIETPFASRTSEEEVITTEVPLVSSTTTTSSTTTSTTTTTTTTTAAPVPEVALADVIVTTTTTTASPVASTNDTSSSNTNNDSSSLSQESSLSGSLEESSSSHMLSQEGFSSSPEETKSVSEPTLSTSYETGPSSSLESHDSSSSDDDLHHNELT